MQRHLAKQIAEKVTADELKQMFINAKNGITDWTKVSSCNLGISKGVAWNIFSKIDMTKRDVLIYTNAIREFGEWLPFNPYADKTTKIKTKPSHQEPNFDLPFLTTAKSAPTE